jgi:sulfite reductase beta subunit-like hemoprotein
VSTAFGNDIKSVRLYVRDGRFNADQLRTLASILNYLGIQEIRAISTQNLIVPLIHSSALPDLYTALKNELAEGISIDGDFTGQIVSCIGASACPIGLLHTEGTRERVATALNALIQNYPDVAPAVYDSIINGINISGCASSCGLNLIGGIGFHGHKKRVDGEIAEFYQLHIGGRINEELHAFACTDPEWLIPADEIESIVVALVKIYLNHVKAQGEMTLREFMVGKRAALSALSEFSIHNLLQCINS